MLLKENNSSVTLGEQVSFLTCFSVVELDG